MTAPALLCFFPIARRRDVGAPPRRQVDLVSDAPTPLLQSDHTDALYFELNREHDVELYHDVLGGAQQPHRP